MIPRQRILHHRETHDLPADFAQRLKRFQEESGLSWSEIARRLGTYPHTVWLWKEGKSRPNPQHQKALVQLAESMSRSAIYKRMQEGEFPRPVRIGPTAVRWRTSDIAAWMESRPVAKGEFDIPSAVQSGP